MRWLVLVPALIVVFACSRLVDLRDVTLGGAPPGDAALDAAGADAAPVDSPGALDAMAEALDCPTYCTTIAAACTGTNAQYGGASDADITAHCMATCQQLPPGALMDTTGNTLGCRLFHADVARKFGVQSIHCPFAGPGGDQVSAIGVCGSPCESFCALEMAACGAAGVTPTGQYADLAACMLACGQFDVTHPYRIDATVIPTGIPSGDSLACRLYHTTNALIPGGAAVHCLHTRAVPTGPCSGVAMP